MINPEDELPKPAKNLFTAPVLDMLGVAELKAYIAVLETEITRVQTVMAAKDAHKAAALAFFKTPPQ